MRKHLERMYSRLMMKSSRTKLEDLQVRALHYYLFPEFRTRDYGKYLRQGFRYILTGSLIYFGMAMMVDINYLHSEIDRRDSKLDIAYNKIEFLNNDARTFVYEAVKDSFMRTEDFLRYKIYEETGLIIPPKVSEEHLQTMWDNAKNNDIPLSIYLRVIQHESNFDSTAVNKTSGAFGFMQTMPTTFNHLYGALKLQGGRTAVNNLKVGAELLRKNFAYWMGKRQDSTDAWEMALACYAMGDSLPRAINRVPSGVQDYIDYVMHYNRR